MLGTSDQSNSSLDFDSKAIPLLIELVILLLKNKSVDQFGLGRDRESKECWRHEDKRWSLTQDYVPKTFKELVGQNAIVRGKIGLAYVFYYPQHKASAIVVQEGLEIDKDALKLIVSKSDESLRDADMTLD
eukprot:Gb_04907 [translate_table: standard]